MRGLEERFQLGLESCQKTKPAAPNSRIRKPGSWAISISVSTQLDKSQEHRESQSEMEQALLISQSLSRP